MIHYKKIITIVLILTICAVCAGMIYNVNHIFPNPENIPCYQGDTARYKGLSIIVGELELYQEDNLKSVYPELVSNPDNNMIGVNNNSNYIIANIKVKNTTEQDIAFGKEGIITWVVEAGSTGNGMDFEYFLELNPDYLGVFKAGEEMDMKLPFSILDKYLTWEELQNSDIKIVYSYYPSKNYICYKAEERENK